METYLPYPSLHDSVVTYDRYTLAHVRRSIIGILDIIHEVEGTPIPYGHPSVDEWRGHEAHLCELGYAVAEAFERTIRVPPGSPSNKDFEKRIEWHLDCATSGQYTLAPPPWWGEHNFHVAQQSALLRLNYPHYSNHFQGVRLDIPPYWTQSRRG